MNLLDCSEPDVIRKLDEVTINRIAAGEIIIRPANAIKEMLENSLDAKSTKIQIVVKFGGQKYLQIQDNGTGIRKEDLSIVCERFTTSKLKKFEDLITIGTFGFRGEALCSISHVAHVTIQTKTMAEKCAYKATYIDGQMKGLPKPCAGNQGTQIIVEDMFYNMPQRITAFKSASEEFSRIYDVLSRYAIHNPNVSFTLKKLDEKIVLRTPTNSSIAENIAIIYGKDIAKELKFVTIKDTMLQFQMDAYYTDVGYSSKKQNYLFFFNHRLVESKSLKEAIDTVFKNFIPRGNHPFMYISLQMESTNIDVNVHPTKHEVKFLHEYEIMDKIKITFENALANSRKAKIFYTQQLLPGASNPLLTEENNEESNISSDKVYDRYLVRSDFKEQKLEKFFGMPSQTLQESINTSQFQHLTKTAMDTIDTIIEPIPIISINQTSVLDLNDECNDSSSSRYTQSPKLNSNMVANLDVTIRRASSHNPFRISRCKNTTTLTSVLILRKRIEDKCQLSLRKMLSDSVFVGSINREFFLLQHETCLYLCNLQLLSKELIYQIVLYDFGNFEQISINPPFLLRDLALQSLDIDDNGWTPDDGPKEELAERVAVILQEKSPMLQEYFSIGITNNGYLNSLPALLSNYVPSICQLPSFILRLASEVDWEEEKRCFQTIAREMATFYSHVPLYLDTNQWKWIVEHVMYAGMKDYLLPPETFREIMLQMANLSHLYRVFERC